VSAASLRTARKGRRCDTHETYTGCQGWIKAGERYRRALPDDWRSLFAAKVARQSRRTNRKRGA
jgi:hypothetical protein